MSAIVFIHVCGAVVGLLSGYMAMMLRKGSSLHGAAGSVFFVSMLLMSSTAAVIATFESPNRLNVVVGLLTFYLVATAWSAARRRQGTVGAFDIVSLLWVVWVIALAYGGGFEAVSSVKGTKDEMPAPIYFVFGTVALLCAINDLRMLRRGNLLGGHRLARHLWRMGLALMIATLSLYPGRPAVFPQWMKDSPLIFTPHIFLLASMLFWLIRVSKRRRAQQKAALAAAPAAA